MDCVSSFHVPLARWLDTGGERAGEKGVKRGSVLAGIQVNQEAN